MVQRVWRELPQRFPTIELDQFVVMPNHVHAIILINPPPPTQSHDTRTRAPNPSPRRGTPCGYPLPSPRQPVLRTGTPCGYPRARCSGTTGGIHRRPPGRTTHRVGRRHRRLQILDHRPIHPRCQETALAAIPGPAMATQLLRTRRTQRRIPAENPRIHPLQPAALGTRPRKPAARRPPRSPVGAPLVGALFRLDAPNGARFSVGVPLVGTLFHPGGDPSPRRGAPCGCPLSARFPERGAFLRRRAPCGHPLPPTGPRFPRRGAPCGCPLSSPGRPVAAKGCPLWVPRTSIPGRSTIFVRAPLEGALFHPCGPRSPRRDSPCGHPRPRSSDAARCSVGPPLVGTCFHPRPRSPRRGAPCGYPGPRSPDPARGMVRAPPWVPSSAPRLPGSRLWPPLVDTRFHPDRLVPAYGRLSWALRTTLPLEFQPSPPLLRMRPFQTGLTRSHPHHPPLPTTPSASAPSCVGAASPTRPSSAHPSPAAHPRLS